MRTALLTILGLLVIAVAAVLIGPSFVDWNAYKPEITQAAKDATGRDLAIDGDIDLQILPSPRLSVAGVRLANAEGASSADMVTLEALQVHVALAPLLSGDVKVGSVTLIRPTIMLEALADGTGNWVMKGKDADQTAPSGDGPGDGGAGGVSVSVESAEIEDGTIVYRDAATGTEHRLSGLGAEIKAASLNGPFEASGSVDYNGKRIGYDASLGAIDTGRAAAVAVTLALGGGEATASFEGSVDLEKGPLLRGTIGSDAADLGALLAALAPGTELPAGIGGALAVRGAIDGTPARLAVEDLTIKLGTLEATGKLAAALDPQVSIEADLSIGRVDLDALLAASAGAAAPASGGSDGGAGGGFALPQGISAKLTAAVDAVDYRGGSVRKVRLDGGLADGVAQITALTAELPGGSNLSITGQVSADQGAPRFVGRMDAVSDNLRSALDWLGVAPAGVAPERLRKGAISAEIDATPTQLSLTNWTTELDTTKASGGLTLLLRERPAFGLTLVVDKVNLDAYLPADSAAPASGDGKPAGSGDNPAAMLLAGFDANVDVKVGEAIYRQTAAKGISVDATIQNGSITVRDFKVGDLAGTRLGVKGTLAGTLSGPSSTLEIDIDTPSVALLARRAGMEPSPMLQRIGAAKISGTVLGTVEAATISLVADALGANAEVKGVVKPLMSPPTYELALKASHPDSTGLLASLTGNKPDVSLGPATVIATVAAADSGKIVLDGTVDIAAGRLAMAGAITPGAAQPTVDGTFSFDHPDVVQLIRLFSPDFKPRQRNLGPAKIQTVLSGDGGVTRLGDLAITLGPINIAGEGQVSAGPQRPMIALRLATGAVAVDPWLPADAPTPAGAAPAVPVKSQARQWSRERIDTSGLLAVDADVSLTAEQVTYGAYILTKVASDIALKDGVLLLTKAGAGLFGGTVAANGALAHGETPSLEMALTVANADVRQAAIAAGDTGQVAGILDYETNVASRGVSEFALVSALRGTGRMNVRDGFVEGIDLPAVSRQLDALDRSVDFLALAQRAMSGGQTPFDSLTGTYTIEQGNLRSDDIELKSSTVAGRATAVVDLPNQTMDLPARFWLVEHANSPPIGVRLSGPLSNPQRTLDMDKMQAYVLQRVVERGILRQLDKGTQQGTQQAPATTDSGQQAAPQPTGPAVPTNPKDALQGILKGLLKN